MAKAVVYLPILDYVRNQIIANAVIVFLVVTIVVLRVVGRLIGPGFGLDDALVLFATPLGITMLICQGVFAPVGNGYSMADHPELVANVPFILELTFFMQIVYIVLLASAKASMLCFFLRIFPTPFIQRWAKIVLAFVGMWMISYVMACIFLCKPVSAQWTGQGSCGAYIPLIQSLIATNAFGDIVIMALPMHSIWGLNMRKTDKVGITASFCLGTACIVCAVFRLIYISTVDLNSNVTGTMSTTILLFTLEPNLAILCISIPMLRPFYVLYKKRVGGSRLQETGDYPSSYKDQSGQGSRGLGSRPRNDDTTVWEMDSYYPHGKGHQVNTVTTMADEESGSEENLTSRHPRQRRDEIVVQTKWTVSREY